jgi:hypothetical protein
VTTDSKQQILNICKWHFLEVKRWNTVQTGKHGLEILTARTMKEKSHEYVMFDFYIEKNKTHQPKIWCSVTTRHLTGTTNKMGADMLRTVKIAEDLLLWERDEAQNKYDSIMEAQNGENAALLVKMLNKL